MSDPLTTSVRLTPLDVALFRDARPFSADDATGARLQSPLPPQIGLLGAMRYLLLTDLQLSFQNFWDGHGWGTQESRRLAVGRTPGQPGSLRLGPVSLALQKDGYAAAYYGMPSDLAFLVKDEDSQMSFYVPRAQSAESIGVETSLPVELTPLAAARFGKSGVKLLWVGDDDGYSVSAEATDRLLPFSSLTDYLTASKTPDTVPSNYLEVEKRIGIERNAQTFTANEGRLYTVEFVRPRYDSEVEAFYVLPVLESAAALPAGRQVIPIGGEARPFEVWKDPTIQLLPDGARVAVRKGLLADSAWLDGGETLQFRVVLLSPAPPGVDKGWMPALPPSLALTVFAAAVSRPKWLSGWITSDGKGGRPRDARPYIPAGSVYFLKARKPAEINREAFVDSVLDTFWYQPSLCDPETAEGKLDRLAGHGVTLVGLVPNVDGETNNV